MRGRAPPAKVQSVAGDLVQTARVHARAEGLPGAGHDDDAYRRVGVEPLERGEELCFQRRGPAVATLGPVQRDECDTIAIHLEQDLGHTAVIRISR